MAFFKTTRDQLKANAFIRNLEFAKTFYRASDPYRTGLHVKWAFKAVQKIKKAKAEYIFSREDWSYVAVICYELIQALQKHGDRELVDICKDIWNWAAKNEDQMSEGGVLSNLRDIAVNNPLEYLRMIEEFAAQGDAEDQFRMGMAFAKGKNPDGETSISDDSVFVSTIKWIVDEQKAIYWLRQAANKGHSIAQHNLGVMCANGNGAPKDEPEAAYWYEKSAAQGFAKAQFNLALMYANGCGVSTDELKAVELYKEAAAQGFASAHHNLGWMYAEGKGVPKDEAQAYARFSVAVALGHPGAAEDLAEMEPMLTPSQRTKAMDLVKQLLDSLAEAREPSS